jgi:hypothetical protein
MPKCKDFGPKINVSQKRKRVDKAVSRKFPQSENWISKNELKRKIFKYMHLTSIYDWGPGELIDSSPCRHSEFTRIGLVDQEVWGRIWYLFLRQNHKQTRHIINKLIKEKDEGN